MFLETEKSNHGATIQSIRMTRWKAAGLHLSVSLLIATCVAALIYFLWFPQPYFVAAGAIGLMLILMGVDVAIGPLLTLIVFSPTKNRSALRFDLVVIFFLQATAFAYGAWVVCQARPVFVVGEVDRLVLVSASQISPDDLAIATLPEAQSLSWTGPRLVGSVPPTDPKTFDFISTIMGEGRDIRNLPQLYRPYPEAATGLLARAKPLSELKGLSSRQQRLVSKLQSAANSQGYGLRFLPMERGQNFYTAIIRSDDAQPVAVINLDAWESGSMGE